MAKVGKAPKKEEKHERKEKPAMKIAEGMEREGFRGIVRIAGKDLRGDLKLKRALLYIKGISYSLRNPVAKLISSELGISEDAQVGSLTDEQIASIDKILFNLDSTKLPAYLLNQRADIYEGNSRHVIMNDLDFMTRRNIENKKKIWSWQGERWIKGKKVRGQRTRNTGRRGLAVGVMKKKEMLGAAPAKPAAAGKPEAATKPEAPAKTEAKK
ncbi:MAG: 30S ribosomal protein S13 [Candidatus Anstonellales archaeon]